MKLVFEVQAVRQQVDGATILLVEPQASLPGQAAEHQRLYVYTADPKEIVHWVSRIGKSMAFVAEDL